MPLSPRNIVLLTHPHHTPLPHLPPTHPLEFQTLLDLYKYFLVASFESDLGQSLLGQEISSLAFYNLWAKKGHMTV